MTDDPFRNREVIFEISLFGNIMRVSAMDTQSLTEITIQCPAGTPEMLMKSNALKRLEFVLKKKGILQ